MNKNIKTFINTCFIISIFFLGLILIRYLFDFSIVLPAILSPIVFISLCVALICSIIFYVLISYKNLRDLYNVNLVDFYDIVNVFSNSLTWVIKSNDIKDLLLDKKISLEQLKHLSPDAVDALKVYVIRDLFINHHLSLEQVKQLNYNASRALKEFNISELFINNHLSLEQLNQLNNGGIIALNNYNIRNLFINNCLSLEQLNQINSGGIIALTNNNIVNLFEQNMISFDLIIRLDFLTSEHFDENTCALILENQITPHECLNLRDHGRAVLGIDSIRDLLIQRQITLEHLNQLDYNARRALENNDIRNMFLNNHLNFDQVLLCDHAIQTALNDVNNRNRLINNEITWANFYREVNQRRVLNVMNTNRTPQTPQTINRSQSTHTTSVHQSVSDSAQALSDRYGQDINAANVKNHIKKLKNNINHFTPNETITPHIYQAAKRGIDRLDNLNTNFQDPKSQLSIKKLIALTQIAAKDDNYRLHTYNHYLEAMTLALYEIQRGYNLDAAGIDNMSNDDKIICTGGTFNKIIEKMVGILPDCHIHFITFDIINFKANQLVKNLIFQFFDDRASLALANEADLISLEFLKPKQYINLLKDIESNDYSNHLLQALLKELSNHIEQALRKTFGAYLDIHFNKYFTIEDFVLNTLSKNEIKTFITKKVDAISCQHNYKQRIYADFSLFYSSKQSKRSKGFTINLRKKTFSNVRTSIDSARQ